MVKLCTKEVGLKSIINKFDKYFIKNADGINFMFDCHQFNEIIYVNYKRYDKLMVR